MLVRLDYVRITLSDHTQKEGHLVDISNQVGTLVRLGSNTAFYLPNYQD